MAEFLQFAVSGLTVGAIYALVAVGFTLIYNASDVINFAQGEFVMLGGMVTVFAAGAGLPLPVAAVLAVIVTVAFGLAALWFAIEPARGASAVTLIIITIAASILMRGLAAVVFDKNFHSLPPLAGDKPWNIGGAAILPQSIVVLVGAGVIVAALWIFLTRSLAARPCSRPPPTGSRLASSASIPRPSSRYRSQYPPRSAPSAASWRRRFRSPATAWARCLHSRHSRRPCSGAWATRSGAVAGGLLLGMLEAFGAGYISSQYKDAIAFIVILAVLFTMPHGLFGRPPSSGCDGAAAGRQSPCDRFGARAAHRGSAVDPSSAFYLRVAALVFINAIAVIGSLYYMRSAQAERGPGNA